VCHLHVFCVQTVHLRLAIPPALINASFSKSIRSPHWSCYKMFFLYFTSLTYIFSRKFFFTDSIQNWNNSSQLKESNKRMKQINNKVKECNKKIKEISKQIKESNKKVKDVNKNTQKIIRTQRKSKRTWKQIVRKLRKSKRNQKNAIRNIGKS
jgi:peptidoglycan hydrolase CwlO-like protein